VLLLLLNGIKLLSEKDTVDHIGKAVARRFDALATVALPETLSRVEVAIVVRRESKSFAQRLRMKALSQMQWTVGAETERPSAVIRV